MGDAVRVRLPFALVVWLFAMLLLGTSAVWTTSATAQGWNPPAPQVTARILLDKLEPGTAAQLGIAIVPEAGWHIYWENPGDSGYPPRFVWHLPVGYRIEAVRHPAPQRLNLGGITMNVHQGATTLITALDVPARAMAGDAIRVGADLDLLVCSDSMCIPKTISLNRLARIGSTGTDREEHDALVAAVKRLPTNLPGGALAASSEPGGLRLHLPVPQPGPGGSFAAFPAGEGGGTFGETRVLHGTAIGTDLMIAPGSAKPIPGQTILVALDDSSGAPMRAWRVETSPASAPVTGRHSRPVWLALGAIGGAVLGGLLLNLMPCVFPILSLKAMTLVRAGAGSAEAQAEAFGYLLGAVLAMMGLGAVVLIMRSAGQAAGWAFQLQSPETVAVLLLLMVAIATNLAGLFELPSLGMTGSPRAGFLGGFGTGALAAFIATPCTGPFMAGALGTALVLPPSLSMAVFAGLGLGLALPFLAIALFEPARRWLPRPGRWMVTLRRLLSLPMFATALALAWLLGRMQGVDSMVIGLTGASVLALGLWWWGLRQRTGQHGWPIIVPASLAVVLAVLSGKFEPSGFALPVSDSGIIAYSPDRLAELRKHHKPVLLYATAQWCLTCKVNEASSLDPQPVRAALRKAGVVLMEADWTRPSPEVTRLINDNGRAGVPLYLWYPQVGAVQTLPQVLTPGLVMSLVKS